MARKKGAITRSFTFDGKRYYVTAENEKIVERKIANKIRDLEEGKVTIANTMLVKDWAFRAVEAYKTG